MNNGVFTVSLDFELYWGLIDQISIEEYEDNLIGVQKVVPSLLNIFHQYNIHSTWATVGFLFFKNKNELKNNYPALLPNYSRSILSPYQYLSKDENINYNYHFAPNLINLIQQYNGQEIATHTFSHYYCLEDGQSLGEFEEDIKLAILTAKNNNTTIKSIVFPRNQFSQNHLDIVKKYNIKSYRGNQKNWAYNRGADKNQTILARGFRLIDSYLNLSGYNTYTLDSKIDKNPVNLPASFFLRPYKPKLNFLESLRLHRLKNSMTYAAKNNEIFHLWWHPHNFGNNFEKNLNFLKSILEHFQYLNKKYGMVSLNMGELSKRP
tara:strand:- start:6919 stop:7881 length:963 start_codon:yes stop_codon:yes gene_type:complete